MKMKLMMLLLLTPTSPHMKKQIEDVLDHQLVSTNGGVHVRYPIKWKGRPLSDCTWINNDEFQCLNSDITKFIKGVPRPKL